MCSIIGSFSKDKFKELVKLNQFRGNFSYSLSVYNTNTRTFSSMVKNFGKFPLELLDMMNIKEHEYIIGHVQAPTNGIVEIPDRIHPTQIDAPNPTYLWHNGLLTPRGIKYIQEKYEHDDEFDTLLLHRYLLKNSCNLSEIEGLFTCLFKEQNNFFLFRTKHGKLYVDDDLSISSERFEDSKCINADTIYQVDFHSKVLYNIDTFRTRRFNYVIPGEM